MFRIGFKDKYKVLHINNEFGNHVVGGAGTYMNEIYLHKTDDTGIVYVNTFGTYGDYNITDFPGEKDILIMDANEIDRLKEIDFAILVVQFYEFANLLSEDLVKNKKVVYVIHSVPTPEPMHIDAPFGINYDIRDKFKKLCDLACVLVCVSNAEKEKLISIYPEYKDKIRVVYNGITIEQQELNNNYKHSRKVFGYIGRMDYRKGIIECIEEIKDLDVELRLACPNNDMNYMRRVLEYIRAADMENRVTFYGWCSGERKRAFFDSLDALIIPSLYEPFGYVALEAMIKGIPVISSNNGGLGEILSGYKYTYNPYIVGALKEQMLYFIKDSNEEVERNVQLLIDRTGLFTSEVMGENYNRLWGTL